MLSGQNKHWVSTTVKTQLEKYGNDDVIGVAIDDTRREITFFLGESRGCFKRNREGIYERDYGNLYKEKQVTKVVNELVEVLGWNIKSSSSIVCSTYTN
jgi:hypothetical protein